jgi:SAM-dependent methyltransferase
MPSLAPSAASPEHPGAAAIYALTGPSTFDLVYDSGCFHHLPPHRRHQYVRLVAEALKPGGVFGLVCFTPEGGNPWGDAEVYQRGSMGGGLGYTEERLRAIWSPVLRVDQLRPMHEPAPDAALFGRGFLWCMLATKADHAR